MQINKKSVFQIYLLHLSLPPCGPPESTQVNAQINKEASAENRQFYLLHIWYK